jgi:hypothetical protein
VHATLSQESIGAKRAKVHGHNVSKRGELRALSGERHTICGALSTDLRPAVRLLRRSPVFTLMSVLSLSVGNAAAVTIRIALGASRSSVRRLVLKQAAGLGLLVQASA